MVALNNEMYKKLQKPETLMWRAIVFLKMSNISIGLTFKPNWEFYWLKSTEKPGLNPNLKNVYIYEYIQLG